jgi:RNA polymerase sigma factor (sigma-70 family)
MSGLRREVRMDGFSDLLRLAKDGDDRAVSVLYDRYGARVLGLIRKRLTPGLRRRYDTMDLGHSVFTKLIEQLPAFEDRGEVAFRHWLYTTAENSVRAKLRRLGRAGKREHSLAARLGLALSERATTPYQAAAQNDDEHRLRRLLESLGDSDREVILLRAEEGLPFAEVAHHLELPSADAARKRYARAMCRLQERWAAR